MPNMPQRADVHINRPLTNFSTAYIQGEEYFAHTQVFKTIPVQKQSDLYFRYTKDYWFRTEAALRAPGTESAGNGFKLTTDQYLCQKWSFHMDVDDETRVNQDDPLDIDRDATALCMRKLLLRREKLFVAAYMAPAVWKGLVSGGVSYDFSPSLNNSGTGPNGLPGFGFNNGFWKSSTSNPAVDIASLRNVVFSQTGFMANTMVVTPDVHFVLENHPVILDRIKYTQRGIVTKDILAAVFGVDNYVIAGAVLNSAQEGQVASMNYMVGNSILLCYTPPAPGILQAASGYIFAWTGLMGAGALGSRVKKIRMEHLESDRIEATCAFSMKMVGSDLGVFGTNILQ